MMPRSSVEIANLAEVHKRLNDVLAEAREKQHASDSDLIVILAQKLIEVTRRFELGHGE